MVSLKAWRANLIHFWLTANSTRNHPGRSSECLRCLPWMSRKCWLCCQILVSFNRGALGGQCRCARRGESQKLRQCGLNFTPLERGFLPCLWVFSAGTCQEQQNLLHHILEQPWGCFSLCWVLMKSAEEPGMGHETFLWRTRHSGLGREGATGKLV